MSGIPTGAGTEGLRSVLLNGVSDQTASIITGVRYHIYTVTSIIIHNAKTSSSGSGIYVYLLGYDARAGSSQQTIQLFDLPVLGQGETFVWNDKFSFYGCENDVTQGTTTTQKLNITGGGSYDLLDITCTYIDQDWS